MYGDALPGGAAVLTGNGPWPAPQPTRHRQGTAELGVGWAGDRVSPGLKEGRPPTHPPLSPSEGSPGLDRVGNLLERVEEWPSMDPRRSG